jgi:hypothetical protein
MQSTDLKMSTRQVVHSTRPRYTIELLYTEASRPQSAPARQSRGERRSRGESTRTAQHGRRAGGKRSEVFVGGCTAVLPAEEPVAGAEVRLARGGERGSPEAHAVVLARVTGAGVGRQRCVSISRRGGIYNRRTNHKVRVA